MLRFSTTLAALLSFIGTIQADEIPLWPGPIPGEQGPPQPERIDPPRADEEPPTTRVAYVGTPSIEVYQPTPEKRTGAAVIIAPGGGYNILAIDKEGTEVADWLNSVGVTAFVLKYRVPRRPGDAADQPPPGPLQDLQRAVSLVRSRADEWGVDPARIGVLGFSAGGNLAARAGTKFATRAYEPVDPSDEQPCRPDFCILIYPAYLTAKDGSLVPDLPVSAETPPMFLAHAHDDRVSPENSVALYLALKKAGVPGELHIYESGGHGFGLRPSARPASTWPARCEEWMKSRGLLGSE
jgi:acetyl esterase/lipase